MACSENLLKVRPCLPRRLPAQSRVPPFKSGNHLPKQAAAKIESEASGNDENVLTYRGIRYRVAKPKAQEAQSHESEDLVEGIYRGATLATVANRF